jgi:two-component system osmolarity sensor histidine kinase EnvZ
MPESEERDAARRDLADMESALEEYLAFARGQAGEEAGPLDLSALCETLADDAAREGVDLELELEDGLTVQAREGALKRALANLVSNAAAHAATCAERPPQRRADRAPLMMTAPASRRSARGGVPPVLAPG